MTFVFDLTPTCVDTQPKEGKPERERERGRGRETTCVLIALFCFFSDIDEFQSIVGSFVGLVETLATAVDKEKMKAIGSRNLLKSIVKQREAKQQQLQALLVEKQAYLERLRVEHESLEKVQAEQQRVIDQFVVHH
eukprot:m.361016 g.361016  ORF g.361016 m.361016 type:complete len:136 (+) comp19955_c2_seq9:331-738(+)